MNWHFGCSKLCISKIVRNSFWKGYDGVVSTTLMSFSVNIFPSKKDIFARNFPENEFVLHTRMWSMGRGCPFTAFSRRISHDFLTGF